MKNVKLAIVIPYYNYVFLEATLKSLSFQTDKRFKVYIGDDAGSVNPLKLLDKYKGDFEYIYHRFNRNLGGNSLVKHWERCLALVGEEVWVMILGDDDVLKENCIDEFYRNLDIIEHNNINVVRYATYKINSKGVKMSEKYKHPKIEKSIDFLFRRLNGKTRSSLSEFIFRKEIILEIGFKDFPLAWHSDVLGILEISYYGLIYSINKSSVSIRSSGLNISSRKDNYLKKNIATFKFYHYLIRNEKRRFTENHVNQLFFRLEKCFLDNKKRLRFWIEYTLLCLSQFEFKRYYKFLIKVKHSVAKSLIK